MATHAVRDVISSRGRSFEEDPHTRCKTQEGVYSIICVEKLKLSNDNGSQSNHVPNVTVKLSRSRHEELEDFDCLSYNLFCINYGNDLHVYSTNITSKAEELLKLIGIKSFEKIYPTNHDFRPLPAKPKYQRPSYSRIKKEVNYEILIGMNNGQIYLADQRNNKKIFNIDHQVEKSKVTCLKWVPNNSNHFIVGYESGFMYTYDVERSSYINNARVPVNSPVMHKMFKVSKGLCIYTFKYSIKFSSGVGQQHINPVYKWCFDVDLPLNDLAFSPSNKYLSVACQDGYLRIIDYEKLEIKTVFRSYFGGYRCVSWSMDSNYLATGGDDNMITVFSLRDDSIICRCVGHKSRINDVLFDSFNIPSNLSNSNIYQVESENPACKAEELQSNSNNNGKFGITMQIKIDSLNCEQSEINEVTEPNPPSEFYRLISVADDTLMCFWDLNIKELNEVQLGLMKDRTNDKGLIKEGVQLGRHMNGSPVSSDFRNIGIVSRRLLPLKFGKMSSKKCTKSVEGSLSSGLTNESKPVGCATKRHFILPPQKFASLSIFDQRKRDKETKRSLSAGPSQRFATVTGSEFGFKNRISPHTNFNSSLTISMLPPDHISITLGSRHCPRLLDVPTVEPLVCKKVSHDRLISLLMDADHIMMSSQDGCLFIWTRPIFSMDS